MRNHSMRGQVLIDYIAILAVALLMALIVLGLSTALPDIGQSIQSRSQTDFWRNQARPFIITDGFYRSNSSRFYLNLEVLEDDGFNLTGVFVNGTQLAFFYYDPTVIDGVSTLECGASTCQTTPCSCDLSLKPRIDGRIVTEPYLSTLSVCGTGQTASPIDIRLVYFRASDPTRNLTESGPVALPFSCQ